jgi:hypothetical protein
MKAREREGWDDRRTKNRDRKMRRLGQAMGKMKVVDGYAEDGRCSTCAAPRCSYERLHVSKNGFSHSLVARAGVL